MFLGLLFFHFHFIIILLSQHKNLLKHTKGFRGRSKNCFRVAIRRLQKSWQYGYRDRRVKRREWSKFWIQKIQAGVRQYSWRYSQFMGSYKQSGMKLDKKVSLSRLKFVFYSYCSVCLDTDRWGGVYALYSYMFQTNFIPSNWYRHIYSLLDIGGAGSQ